MNKLSYTAIILTVIIMLFACQASADIYDAIYGNTMPNFAVFTGKTATRVITANDEEGSLALYMLVYENVTVHELSKYDEYLRKDGFVLVGDGQNDDGSYYFLYSDQNNNRETVLQFSIDESCLGVCYDVNCRIHVICGDCYGAMKQACSNCLSSGNELCPICGGTKSKTCYHCSGSGISPFPQIFPNSKPTVCSGCEGRGMTKCNLCSNGRISCRVCGGDGETSCEACNGSGYTSQSIKEYIKSMNIEITDLYND